MTFEECDLTAFNRKRQISYFQTVRFARLVEIAEQVRLPFLAIDIDALFLGPIGALLELCSGSDIAIRMRPDGKTDSYKLLAGLVYLRDTPGARSYLKQAVARMILHLFHGRKEEMIDQLSLYRALPEATDIVVVDLNLQPKAFSYESSEKLVYFGKGDLKNNELPKIFSNRFGQSPNNKSIG